MFWIACLPIVCFVSSPQLGPVTASQGALFQWGSSGDIHLASADVLLSAALFLGQSPVHQSPAISLLSELQPAQCTPLWSPFSTMAVSSSPTVGTLTVLGPLQLQSGAALLGAGSFHVNGSMTVVSLGTISGPNLQVMLSGVDASTVSSGSQLAVQQGASLSVWSTTLRLQSSALLTTQWTRDGGVHTITPSTVRVHGSQGQLVVDPAASIQLFDGATLEASQLGTVVLSQGSDSLPTVLMGQCVLESLQQNLTLCPFVSVLQGAVVQLLPGAAIQSLSTSLVDPNQCGVQVLEEGVVRSSVGGGGGGGSLPAARLGVALCLLEKASAVVEVSVFLFYCHPFCILTPPFFFLSGSAGGGVGLVW